MDKFAAYYNNEEKMKELSEYVHQNFKLIWTKMSSEMRRMLDIEPNMDNSDGYVSLMMSLQGRLFNEMIYSLSGSLQSLNMKFTEVVPHLTICVLFDLIEGRNPLNGRIRDDVKEDVDGFKKYYKSQIDGLRKAVEALPKNKDSK